MKPTLNFNCPEKWENMKIGVVSRYCESCRKDVQDFTTMSREEILHYLWTHRNQKVCGRITKSQLDYHHEEILVTIESYLKREANTNLSFYLLAASAALMLSCSSPGDGSQPLSEEQDPTEYWLNAERRKEELAQALGIPATNSEDTIDILSSTPIKPTALPDSFMIFAGDISIDSPFDSMTTTDVRRIAEVMPEFYGGYSALTDYLRENLLYPEWEKKNKIEGTVLVSFVIQLDGKVYDSKILRSVPGARNFDDEVLRIVNDMPVWNPGREGEEVVAVEYILPIRFRI